MRSGEPKILTGIYDLVNWYMSRTERFPKPLRVTLGDRIQDVRQSIMAWIGHAKHADTWKLRESMFQKVMFQRSGVAR
jgi:hypothetical protein